MAIKIKYDYYEEYPLATFVSRTCRIISFFASILGFPFGFIGILGKTHSDIFWGIFIIALTIILIFGIAKLEPFLIAKILRSSKSQSQNKKEYNISDDEMLLAYAKQIKANYYLSKGVRNREFQVEALRVGMLPNEYKKLCKKWVVDFEDTRRKYNTSSRQVFNLEENKKKAIMLIGTIDK